MNLNFQYKYQLPFSASDVWKVAGEFGSLDEIHSGTVTCTLQNGGNVRKLTTVNGALLWERLINFSEKDKTLSYLIFDVKNYKKSPYGIGYIGNIIVSEVDSDTSIFCYEAEFELQVGFNEQEAYDELDQFSKDCVLGIQRYLNRKF
ncbi:MULTISPECIES: SRPBCC family protein [Acinetobacter]|jgi:hypothetical protein|uniref:SRPBCC family protein n=1 Tax=Acinetobacter TaxID=469 RepID=UPI000F746C1A|nr:MULTISPECIES: SRPBCC family protein [Acinetobacter]MCU4387321.1 SRPBCC family protein [Acinetobacter haemolyticus]RSN74774.1 SRPBCC family protein [Acinetobacter haemolyticus]